MTLNRENKKERWFDLFSTCRCLQMTQEIKVEENLDQLVSLKYPFHVQKFLSWTEPFQSILNFLGKFLEFSYKRNCIKCLFKETILRITLKALECCHYTTNHFSWALKYIQSHQATCVANKGADNSWPESNIDWK